MNVKQFLVILNEEINQCFGEVAFFCLKYKEFIKPTLNILLNLIASWVLNIRKIRPKVFKQLSLISAETFDLRSFLKASCANCVETGESLERFRYRMSKLLFYNIEFVPVEVL